jgi:hypothetical protein
MASTILPKARPAAPSGVMVNLMALPSVSGVPVGERL